MALPANSTYLSRPYITTYVAVSVELSGSNTGDTLRRRYTLLLCGTGAFHFDFSVHRSPRFQGELVELTLSSLRILPVHAE